MRGQQLSEAQITALLDPPPDQRELVRHYTLFAADLAAIRRCRGDHNRLGHALMLCYLRHPGRPLRAGERPPRSLLLFIHFVARINSGAQSAPTATFYLRRTYTGHPSSSIRLSEATAMATSVVGRPLVRERRASPITRL